MGSLERNIDCDEDSRREEGRLWDCALIDGKVGLGVAGEAETGI